MREHKSEDRVPCTHQSRCSVFQWASPYLSSLCVLPMTCVAFLYWSHQHRLCGRITSLIFIWSSLLPAWTAAGQSACAWERTRLCISGCVFVCVCHPCVCCALMCAVYYLTWRGKMSECKMSHVTYSVSWLLQGPAGQTQALFSIQNLHSESPLNNSNTTEVKIGAGSKSITVSFLCPCQNSEEIPC